MIRGWKLNVEKLTDNPSGKRGMACGSTPAIETSHRYDTGTVLRAGADMTTDHCLLL
jgi:hypothetical protein